MLSCLVCRSECCRALSESDSADDGNPYLSVVQLDAHSVAIHFDYSVSDSLEDDVYYDEFIVHPRQSALQCIKMLDIARKEANDVLEGPVDTQQLERVALMYEQAIGASVDTLKRKIIREYDRVMARFGPSPVAERESRQALEVAQDELADHDTRCQAYRRAIRATSVSARKAALKKEYNAYLMKSRVSQ